MVPAVLSPIVGIGLPKGSVPCAVAIQSVVEIGVNVQLKSSEAPAASVEEPLVQGAQPVPATKTSLIVNVVLFVSVTVIVTDVPAAIVVPGVTFFVVNVVAEVPVTVIVPFVVSFVAGTSLPSESFPW